MTDAAPGHGDVRPDLLATETLRQFAAAGEGHFLDNADADTLREMVRLVVARSRGLEEALRALDRFPVWRCPKCGDWSECEPGTECEVCCEGTIEVVEVIPLAAALASLGLPDEEGERRLHACQRTNAIYAEPCDDCPGCPEPDSGDGAPPDEEGEGDRGRITEALKELRLPEISKRPENRAYNRALEDAERAALAALGLPDEEGEQNEPVLHDHLPGDSAMERTRRRTADG